MHTGADCVPLGISTTGGKGKMGAVGGAAAGGFQALEAAQWKGGGCTRPGAGGVGLLA